MPTFSSTSSADTFRAMIMCKNTGTKSVGPTVLYFLTLQIEEEVRAASEICSIANSYFVTFCDFLFVQVRASVASTSHIAYASAIVSLLVLIISIEILAKHNYLSSILTMFQKRFKFVELWSCFQMDCKPCEQHKSCYHTVAITDISF
jgi:hypothetical protein